MNNPRFPVDVLKARLKRDPLLALELVNPELDLVRQLALNGKTARNTGTSDEET